MTLDPGPGLGQDWQATQPLWEAGMAFGDDGTALEELRRCEADLEAYAAGRELELRADPAYPGALPPERQPGPVKHAVWSLVGRMPGGTIGKLRHQATFGRMAGLDAGVSHTVFIGRQPETVTYVPLLNVRPDDVVAGLFEWAGDSRPRQRQEFESAELNRRFVIEIAKGQDQTWLYRLFSPTLIDWLAHETPPDFGFRLSSGSFSCEAPRWRGQAPAGNRVDSGHLDLIAEAGGKVAGRIRDEVLEQIGLGTVPATRGNGYATWTKAERGGRLSRFVAKLAGGAGDSSVPDFAAELGYGPIDPAAFHAAHILLPLPGVIDEAFEGTLPDGRSASLLWMEYESDYYGIRYYVGLVAEVGYSGPPLWFDRDEVVAAAESKSLPGGVLSRVRDAGLGVSTGGGSAIVYCSATGWDGRPGKADVKAMMDVAPAVFEGLEAS